MIRILISMYDLYLFCFNSYDFKVAFISNKDYIEMYAIKLTLGDLRESCFWVWFTLEILLVWTGTQL